MQIKKPFLRVQDFFWADYTKLWKNFTNGYNDGLPSREKLKAGHMNVYYRLVHMAQKSLQKHNRNFADVPELGVIDNGQWLLVQNARKQYIASINFTSPMTTKRYFERLEEAGVIKTIASDDFEELAGKDRRWNDILINPDFLLIYDYYQPDFIPTSPHLPSTEKQGFQKEKVTNCVAVSSLSTLPESNNNEIMPVQPVEKGIALPVDGLLFPNGNITRQEATPNQTPTVETAKQNGNKKSRGGAKFDEKNTKNTPEPAPAADETPDQEPTPEQKGKYDELRHQLAIEFYNFMADKLFKNHDIYPAEATRTVKYLEKTYFKPVVSQEQGDWFLKTYKWRIAQAASWVERKGFDFSNIFPYAYVNVHNPKGFTATKAWQQKAEADKIRRAKQKVAFKKELADNMILAEAINGYMNAPTLRSFNRQTKWINEKAPHLYEIFVKSVNIKI